jgi:hypothetical protein
VTVNAFDPALDFGDNEVNYQKIIERMARAKWIAGMAIVTPQAMAGLLTPLGQMKMEQARAAFLEYAPEALTQKFLRPAYIESETFVKTLGLLRSLSAVAQDLQPPPLDPAESSTLFMFMLTYGIKHTAGDPLS